MSRRLRVLHAVNGFDFAGDATRCVGLLNRHSRHEHKLFVLHHHPYQWAIQFDEPEIIGEKSDLKTREELFDWSDCVIFQFFGWEEGRIRTLKPCAFRNSNSYFDPMRDKVWHYAKYSAKSLEWYKLLGAAHMTASEFMPGCRHLPSLIPVGEGAYSPDWSSRVNCVAYSKHAAVFDKTVFDGAERLSLDGKFHSNAMVLRRARATVAIDNVSDGHYGLASLESMSQGIPAVVFNHPLVKQSLAEMAGEAPPFIECGPSLHIAASAATKAAGSRDTLGRDCFDWMLKFYNPKRLVEKYWDAFVEELWA